MIDDNPFEHVSFEDRRFRLPRRKWRELLFVGSLQRAGDFYVRDSSRPIASFKDPDLFPEGVRFRLCETSDEFVLIERVD